MNTALNEYIGNAWHHLKEAAIKKDWPATQEAFRKMATAQDLDERSRNLQQQIQGLTPTACPNGPPPLTIKSPPAEPNPLGDNGRRGTIRPRELRIGPHRETISINNQITIQTAKWIIKQGKPLPEIKNFIHRSRSDFTSTSVKIKRLEDGSNMDIGDDQPTLLRKARRLMNACGFRETKMEVLLEDGAVIPF